MGFKLLSERNVGKEREEVLNFKTSIELMDKVKKH